MKNGIECRRQFPVFEVRADKDEEGNMNIRGYAAVFDSLSKPIFGMFKEVLRKGAFKKSIKEADVRSLWNHEDGKPLGRLGNDTLTLKEDRQGLAFENTLPDTTWGRDAYESISRGDVGGMSFRFIPIKEVWHEETDKETGQLKEVTRELKEVELIEVSPVTFPAYEGTEVEARKILEGSDIDQERIKSFIDLDSSTIEQEESGEPRIMMVEDEPRDSHSKAAELDELQMLFLLQKQHEAERS